MAFFGLTKLGEQNLFLARSKDGNDLTLFANGDFITAFDQTVGMYTTNNVRRTYVRTGDDAVNLRMDQLPAYFEKLYCGPLYPEKELIAVKERFQGFEEIPKEDFVRALIEMKGTRLGCSYLVCGY